MTQYRKKPVIIEAIQWIGSNLREVIAFTDGPPDTRTMHAQMAWDDYSDLVDRDGLKIHTLEGKMLANVGDWIIKGVKGEFYPCKPEIFAATYEPAIFPQAFTLPPHQQRVLDEKRELDEKLQKLTAFISSDKFVTIVPDEDERGRLVCQEETMKVYSAILAERIAAF